MDIGIDVKELGLPPDITEEMKKLAESGGINQVIPTVVSALKIPLSAVAKDGGKLLFITMKQLVQLLDLIAPRGNPELKEGREKNRRRTRILIQLANIEGIPQELNPENIDGQSDSSKTKKSFFSRFSLKRKEKERSFCMLHFFAFFLTDEELPIFIERGDECLGSNARCRVIGTAELERRELLRYIGDDPFSD